MPKPRYTLEEYFALELESELKYEYWHGEVFVMSGASPEHESIVLNVLTDLDNALEHRPCRVFPSNLRVKVPAAPPYRYPDVSALCGEPIWETIGGVRTLTNPALIAEVLSPSTESFDRGDKFDYYQSIPGFCEYLLLAQDRPHVVHYAKQPDGRWLYQVAQGMDAQLELESLGVVLPLSRIYRNVDFETAEKGKYPRMAE